MLSTRKLRWIPGFLLLGLMSIPLRAQTLPDLRIPFETFGRLGLVGPTPDAGPKASLDLSSGSPLLAAAPCVRFSAVPSITLLAPAISSPACERQTEDSPWVVNCPSLGQVAFSAFGCFSQPDFSVAARNHGAFEAGLEAIKPVVPQKERFHWRPALWQSFEFLLVEHAWRLAWDPYARYLLVHKPFWKDYLSSAEHFDMNRWGDGDDFLVNYIGHPLEGSVSGNIFLQNDPQGRSARFGKSPAYWQSRLKALGWAAVYSAYFEIGPVLSEAALGNEGGYAYVPDCGFYPTCTKEPGKQYKPPTNNTGWVDFVVTPLIGTGWLVLEDAIEAEVVDKLADGSPALGYKILRGALSPSRTMANFLAGKPPWYRYSAERETAAAFGIEPGKPLPRPEWMSEPRWNMGMQFTALHLPMDWNGCSECRVFTPGFGSTFGYRLTRSLYFDSEFNVFPGSNSSDKRGGAQEVLAGLKVGRTFRSWGAFTQVRPGFIHYDKALVPGTSSDYESTTRFALDLGGIFEYYASRHSTIRFNVGTTLVHYLTGQVDPRQPPVSVLSDDYYTLKGSFHLTSGYIFRF